MNQSSKHTPNSEGNNSYLKYYSIAFELVILNLVMIVGGYWLDEFLNTSPVIVLVGVALAMAGTIKILMSRLK